MIIKSSRLPSRIGAKTTAQHVLRGPANEEITLLSGSEQDLHDWVRDARKRKKEFAIRHWKLSPERDITPEQEAEAVTAMATEFGFAPERVVLIRHKKPRHGGEASEFHLHLLVPEVNPLTGKVLSTRWDYARHEKVSRKLEAAWGHDVVPGRFNAPVLNALKAEGHGDVADYLRAEGLQPDIRAESQYPPGLDQEVRRKARRTMAQVRDAVLDARALTGGDADEFRRIVEQDGLRVVQGDKGSRWVIQALAEDGSWAFAGALHRLAGMRAAEADSWMLGTAPRTTKPTRGRDYNDNDRTNWSDEGSTNGREMDRRRDGGAAGGDAHARRPAQAGPAGNDAILRGQPGSGGPREAADGAARHSGGRAWYRPTGGTEGAAPSTGGTTAPRVGEAGRAHRYPVAQGGTAGRPASPSTGGGAPACIEASCEAQKIRRIGRLKAVIGAARARARLDHGEVAEWVEMTMPPRIGSTFGHRRVVRLACDDDERAERQRRFRLLMLRRAYPLCAWLPADAVLFMTRVDWEPASGRLLLTLMTGTKLLDTGDRILLQGHTDDVSVAEIAACVERRGWGCVVVEGTDEFRREMARELIIRGIEVEDCPLDPREVEQLRMRAMEGTPPSLMPSPVASIRA